MRDLDDVTEKELLVEISLQLEAIRHQLQENDPDGEDTVVFECELCGDDVPSEALVDHKNEEHNGIGIDLDAVFDL